VDWLKRAVVIVIAYVASCLTAPLVLALQGFVIGLFQVNHAQSNVIDLLFDTGVGTWAGVSFGLIPLAFAIFISEAYCVRDLWIYPVTGAAFALVLSFKLIGTTSIGFLIAGIVAGLVYWLIAGRHAGIVREARKRRSQNVTVMQ
jgi:hypothetical protein